MSSKALLRFICNSTLQIRGALDVIGILAAHFKRILLSRDTACNTATLILFGLAPVKQVEASAQENTWSF